MIRWNERLIVFEPVIPWFWGLTNGSDLASEFNILSASHFDDFYLVSFLFTNVRNWKRSNIFVNSTRNTKDAPSDPSLRSTLLEHLQLQY